MDGNNLKVISGWGRFPVHHAKEFYCRDGLELSDDFQSASFIVRGNARSYGDSSLGNHFFSSKTGYKRFIAFDENTGLLRCEAGVLLSEVIDVFLPKGWFLKVTPGTKLITVGGAIASDMHGKNHHIEGCFSQCVDSLRLMIASGEVVTCSRQENRELFLATCGGMGLTGVILEASFYLKPVNSQFIEQRTIKTRNLKETFEAFEASSNETYSVAWIDCLAKGENLGRSLLMVGDFADDGDLDYRHRNKASVPFDFPTFALNGLSVKVFNTLYYGKASKGTSAQRVSLDTFFYPLDAIGHWNRIYGKNGFVQYQFILPKEVSFEGLQKILEKIADKGMGSFLAVLKLYGPENEHYLSFPMEGYSLALDFKMQKGLLPFLDELDEVVVALGGRIYLAKDARMKRSIFEQSYPRLETFKELRESLGLNKKFTSLQSERLGL